jgi:hypothetical protein
MRAPVQASCPADFVGARIAVLLRDPRVAERVRRRLARAAEADAADLPGVPPCLRARGAPASAPVQVKSGRCRAICGSVDCLCGSYPRQLSDREVSHGRRLEPIAP